MLIAAAFTLAEPAHHRAPARPFTLPPSRPTQHIAATTRISGGTPCALGTIVHTISANIAAVATAGEQHAAVAEAVGGHSPRQL